MTTGGFDYAARVLETVAAGVRSASERTADPALRAQLIELEKRTKSAAELLRDSIEALRVSPQEAPAIRSALHSMLRQFEMETTAHAVPMMGKRPSSLIRRREYEVLCRVAMGQTNAQIAEATRLSHNTVKSYLRNLMQRMGVRNRVEAVSRAREAGIL